MYWKTGLLIFLCANVAVLGFSKYHALKVIFYNILYRFLDIKLPFLFKINIYMLTAYLLEKK